jgi:hypothetical protein
MVLATGPLAGYASVVPFIVNRRAAPLRRVIVPAGVNTWQACNNWGGRNLYDYNSSNQQQAVLDSKLRRYLNS